MKVAINTCFGGFSISEEAILKYAEYKGLNLHIVDTGIMVHVEDEKGNYFGDDNIKRNDPFLIKVIEELGENANGLCAEISIVEIPDGTDYIISEYDGVEHVAERHQTWR